MENDDSLPVLDGDGFSLRPLEHTDADILLALLREPGVARWWGSYDAERLERDFFDQSSAYTYLVIVDDVVAGVLQFHEETDPGYRHAGIDITLGERYQDRGLGTRALRRLIRYLIDERGHHRMTIDPSVHNPCAVHVYEKVGFRPVGVMRKYERDIHGEWSDGLLMDLLAEEFIDTH
ncbi:MAG: GNAT family N-acetyltransferase [Coriobacteriia bacterium]|nr:GNAT family N-acetyltransferase [Coriobacteriia bacterium]MBN2839702.1 GNAT family N-acetyltransferase [Coriobacteriia bacterium]